MTPEVLAALEKLGAKFDSWHTGVDNNVTMFYGRLFHGPAKEDLPPTPPVISPSDWQLLATGTGEWIGTGQPWHELRKKDGTLLWGAQAIYVLRLDKLEEKP
jgi:hypothetical protein